MPDEPTRKALIAAVLARSRKSGRRVYGYCSDKAGCDPLPKTGVPKEWDRIVVEGDKEWTKLPREGEK